MRAVIAGNIDHVCDMVCGSTIDPGGVAAISRWLSGATPPATIVRISRPRRGRASKGSFAGLSALFNKLLRRPMPAVFVLVFGGRRPFRAATGFAVAVRLDLRGDLAKQVRQL